MYTHNPFQTILLILLTSNSCQSETPSIIGNQPYYRRRTISTIQTTNNSSQSEFNHIPQDTVRPLVTIKDGTLQGSTLRTVHGRAISAFQSIPYAKPPVGPLRFRDPIKNEPWKGTLNALPQSPQCIQLDLIKSLEAHGQEDCLYLSVYTPQNHKGKRLPVLVWLHGGAWFFGSGGIYGPRYLLERNVILVTINYRLGPFGFFSTEDLESPGNQGLKDQVLGLKWVQDNIASFHGDPSRVTIFGESAGAAAVQFHIVSPLSRGLFHQAISESGSALCYWAHIYNASQTARKVGEIHNCPTGSSKEMMECLRNVPSDVLVQVQKSLFKWYIFPNVIFGPTVEPQHAGAFMTKTPEKYYEDGEAHDVPWITGLNRDELVYFVSGMIQNPNQVNDINTKWDQIGPIVLGMDYNSTEVNVRRARRVWDYYMGNQKFSWATRHNFARMLSDRYFGEGTLDAVRYHSRYTKQNVYTYHFTYQGRFSNVQQFGGRPEDWGVSHMDDLIYLLNNPDYYQTLKPGDPELEMSYVFTKIWEQFATHGIPYVPGRDTVGMNRTIWQPIEKAKDRFSSIRFLDLNLKSKMIDDPYVDRYNFWRLEIDPNP